jgi:hypothetical protein
MWHRRKGVERPDYARIAQLEKELGLSPTSAARVARSEAPVHKCPNPERGPEITTVSDSEPQYIWLCRCVGINLVDGAVVQPMEMM